MVIQSHQYRNQFGFRISNFKANNAEFFSMLNEICFHPFHTECGARKKSQAEQKDYLQVFAVGGHNVIKTFLQQEAVKKHLFSIFVVRCLNNTSQLEKIRSIAIKLQLYLRF